MHKKRKSLCLVLFLLIALLALPATAEAKTSKKTINAVNKVVKTYFNAQKKLKTSVMNKCLVESNVGRFKSSYLEKYIKKHNKKLSYKIKSTKVKGKTATVTVNCTYQSAYNLYNAAILDAALHYFHANPTEKEIYDYVSNWIKKHAGEYSPVAKKKTIKIKLVKRKGAWKISSFTDDMKNILYLDLFQLINDI